MIRIIQALRGIRFAGTQPTGIGHDQSPVGVSPHQFGFISYKLQTRVPDLRVLPEVG